jgi:hypothetical protein
MSGRPLYHADETLRAPNRFLITILSGPLTVSETGLARNDVISVVVGLLPLRCLPALAVSAADRNLAAASLAYLK